MSRDDALKRRGRYGRGSREGRPNQNRNQWEQRPPSGRDDWGGERFREGGEGPRDRPYGQSAGWQEHDYGYGGPERFSERERGLDRGYQSGRFDRPGDYGQGEYGGYGYMGERGYAPGQFGQSQYDPRQYRGRFGQGQYGPNQQPGQFRGEWGEQHRPDWPEQRGSFGEREYGQHDYGHQGPALPVRRRSEAAYWPRESMGMGTLQPYWSPAQWGSGVGMGQMIGGTGYDYTYDRERGGEYGYPYGPMGHDSDAHGASAQPSYAGRGPKGYVRPDDRIHEELCEKLTRDPRIDASHVEIQVKDGEVTLEGHVHDRRWKHLAEDLAESISGVKDIHNHLKIERHEPGFRAEMGRGSAWENGRDRDDEAEMQRTRSPRAGKSTTNR